MKFKHMFSPIQIGPMTVKNRFVVPPMGNNFAKTDGTWSDESVAYYAERAKGQFGLITIEATVVHKGAKGGPLQQLMEEIFRKQFLQSRYMSSLKDTEMQQSAQ